MKSSTSSATLARSLESCVRISRTSSSLMSLFCPAAACSETFASPGIPPHKASTDTDAAPLQQGTTSRAALWKKRWPAEGPINGVPLWLRRPPRLGMAITINYTDKITCLQDHFKSRMQRFDGGVEQCRIIRFLHKPLMPSASNSQLCTANVA